LNPNREYYERLHSTYDNIPLNTVKLSSKIMSWLGKYKDANLSEKCEMV
jgi:hypothetical protein